MGRFDSWQPVIPSLGEGLDYLGQALDSKRNFRLKEKDLAQKSRFENEQNAAILAGKREQERRDKVREVQEQDDRRQKLTGNLNALLGKGLGTQAQALAASSQFEDPNTHQMRGVQLTPEIGAAPTRGEVDTTGNQALAKFLQGKAAGQPGQQQPDQAATDDTAGALDFMEGQIHEGAYNKAQGAYDREKANPTRYRATYPGGASAVIDTQESRRATVMQAQEDARRYRAAAAQEPNPQVREQFLRAASQVEAGMTNMDKAGVNNVEGREDAQGFKVERDERNQLTRQEQLEKARISGAAAARRAGPDSVPERRYDLAVSAEARNRYRESLTQGEWKDVLESHRTLTRLTDLLKSDNSANHKLAAGLWAKWASGPGAVQQSERQEFMNTIGGQGEAYVKTFNNWVKGGKLPDTQRQIIVDAIGQTLLPGSNYNYNGVRQALDTSFRNDPNPDVARYADWATSQLDSYVQPAPLVTPSREGGGGGAPARPPAPGGGGGAPAAGGKVLKLPDGRVVRDMGGGKYKVLSGP